MVDFCENYYLQIEHLSVKIYVNSTESNNISLHFIHKGAIAILRQIVLEVVRLCFSKFGTHKDGSQEQQP